MEKNKLKQINDVGGTEPRLSLIFLIILRLISVMVFARNVRKSIARNLTYMMMNKLMLNYPIHEFC